MTDAQLAIEIRVTAPIRAWQRQLAATLQRDGHRLRLICAEGRPNASASIAVLLILQRFLYAARSSAFAIAGSDNTADFNGEPDLILSLAGAPQSMNGPCLVPQFDGAADEKALFAALLAGRAPVLSLNLSSPGAAPCIIARGLPAIEDPAVLARSLDQVIARLVALLRRAVSQIASGTALPGATSLSPSMQTPARSAFGFFTRGVARRIIRRLTRGKGQSEHWFTGWRQEPGTGVAHGLAWPSDKYRRLPDDGQRYFADPFPFAHEGRSYIFCEEYPFATSKGVISVFERGDDGMFSASRVVLERPYHLSYPQIIARDGAIFMLPETGAAGRLELYRAERFPDAWTCHSVLVEDVVASDATWVEYGGRHWIFATCAGDGGSTWDQLHIYHAPELDGPWSAHAGNPVLIDAGAARPGGAMWLRDGVLWRVAQDCRSGYGGGLTICRVDVLTPTHFAQTIIKRLAPPDAAASGVHTLNTAGGLETIDWRG